MNHISDSVIKVIKKNHITPRPRWQFLVKRWMLWSAAALSVLLGSVAVSGMLFRMVNSDWDIIHALPQSPFAVVVGGIPYVWVIVLALFVALAYYNVRHTSGAYKYQAYWIVAGSIVISVILGTALYAFGLGPRADQFLNQRVPFMQDITERRLHRWAQPSQGLLAGEIVSLGSSEVQLFIIIGVDGNEWDVRRVPELIMPPGFDPVVGDRVRMTGALLDPVQRVFVADTVYPLYQGPGIHGGRVPHHSFPAGPLPHRMK